MSETQPKANVREEDIRPAALMRDKQQCVDWDREFLLSRKREWVIVQCPACDEADNVPFGEKAGFSYVECGRCGTVYTNPRPSQALVHEFYARSKNYEYWNRHVYPATEANRRQSIIGPRADRLISYCRRFGISGGTLLEVGAAFGTFCEEIRDRKVFDHIIALEPTPDLAASCRARGLETIEKPIEQIGDGVIADVVVAFEVIEHLFCPRAFIEQCARLLRRGGVLLVTCPNARGFDVATLRTVSSTFDHEHVNYFNPQSLSGLLARCGLDEIETVTPGKLDAELVRKQVLAGHFGLASQPFLRQVLVDEWERLGVAFQSFLAENRLSSHMWAVARKRS